MFVHSNDLFYAPGAEGIALFDDDGSLHLPSSSLGAFTSQSPNGVWTLRVFDRAGAPRKRFLLVAGADHNDALLAEGPGLVEPVARFIVEALP